MLFSLQLHSKIYKNNISTYTPHTILSSIPYPPFPLNEKPVRKRETAYKKYPYFTTLQTHISEKKFFSFFDFYFVFVVYTFFDFYFVFVA